MNWKTRPNPFQAFNFIHCCEDQSDHASSSPSLFPFFAVGF
jgi:hypothetical protein